MFDVSTIKQNLESLIEEGKPIECIRISSYWVLASIMMFQVPSLIISSQFRELPLAISFA